MKNTSMILLESGQGDYNAHLKNKQVRITKYRSVL